MSTTREYKELGITRPKKRKESTVSENNSKER